MIIFTNLLMPWVDNLPLFFAEINRILKKDGLFIFSTLGPDSLQNIKSIWNKIDDYEHVNPFIDMHIIGDLILKSGLGDPVLDTDKLTINYKNISKSISKSLGRKYAFHSTLNAGAFAINDNVNIWKCFQKNIKLAAKKGRIFGTDQVALALSIYEDGLPSEFLPAYCSWMCEFNMPKFDSENGQFVEPYH